MDGLYQLFKDFGVAGGFVVGLLWLLKQAGEFLAPFVRRLFEVHADLVSSLQTSLGNTTDALSRKDRLHRQTHAAIAEGTRLAEALSAGTEKEKDVREHCEAIRRALEIASE